MIKNFGRDFIMAMIGEIITFIAIVLGSLIWITVGSLIMAFFIFSIVIKIIIECEKDKKKNYKFNWTNYCATCTNRNQCSEEGCTMYHICLIKDPSQFTSKENKE